MDSTDQTTNYFLKNLPEQVMQELQVGEVESVLIPKVLVDRSRATEARSFLSDIY